ncbi:NAD-dependent epimerase/dehydratase family protein [Roseiconus lacunae]|uniref:NAD-dependent epimerase/dehydratase family protein n=1 Tax=Roseiconus lacunae TaxID=2605694 RepID=A0ABT7PBU7_9BACT|nr:NAD-dependent epimerase/dehydratase family protein [Roseiconus lacunae]MDM4013970.1 NAD-dependent epimerase/dehydratase family protein [Roseiconus lacunae]WRQ53265.1 NAD-dependent epimerase/dehydratase family protein [Stieleria sp. HD01]
MNGLGEIKHALVTGATGFIGQRLVEHLTLGGTEVSCFVRPTSDCSVLESSQPRIYVGQLNDLTSLRRAIEGTQVVFHLAGTTKALLRQTFHEANVDGARHVAQVCAECDDPPTMIHVSSLAAVGASSGNDARVESDLPSPVSDYGRSKLAGEETVKTFANRIPVTIVRPPIVVGPNDHDGFEMFQGIKRFGVHIVPGSQDHRFSVVHVDDLCDALIRLAQVGKRVSPLAIDDGVYFVTLPERPTYAELGHMIARSLGRQRARIIRLPMPVLRAIAGANQWISKLRHRPHILNLDKAREAAAGSWTCSADKLRKDTDLKFGCSLQERLDQTSQWYRDHHWF